MFRKLYQYWFGPNCTLYLARGMSGRIKSEVVKEAKADVYFFRYYGYKVNCPVEVEQVENTHTKLQASVKEMDAYWKRDKELIRNSNVVLDMTPHLNSEGVKHELGYARYCLWKPVVRIFPKHKKPPIANVAFYEDDYITEYLEDAAFKIDQWFGSRHKRFVWRLKMLNKSLPKWIGQQLKEFWL